MRSSAVTAESTPPLIAATTLLPPAPCPLLVSESISPALRFQWSSKALCSASTTRVSACSLPAGRGPPRASSRSAFDQFSKGRAGGYARRTAIDLVAYLLEDVVRDPDCKAGDVAARGVT